MIGGDVGVGASCIYPLLAVKHLGWTMRGSEANEENLKSAQSNVERNLLPEKIRLHLHEAFFEFLEEKVHFTMCNPPFFDEGHMEGGESSAGKEYEISTKGGEVEFLQKMLVASLRFMDPVDIFTCMLGHKSSIGCVKRSLIERRATEKHLSFVFTEFCQGRTMRWGVAWSFREGVALPDESAIKKRREEKKKHTPVHFELDSFAPNESMLPDTASILLRLTSWLNTVEVEVKNAKVDDERISFTMKTFKQDWKNQRRKRREQLRKEEAIGPPGKRSKVSDHAMEVEEEEEAKAELQLCCRVAIHRTDEKAGFELRFIDGAAGKDAMHQLVQYLRNKTRGH